MYEATIAEKLILLAAPFGACLVLTGIHCYLGIHVVSRGVIFVDLALAQIAALGTTIALLSGHELNSQTAYFYSLGFTFVGAAIFALARFREERIPQEAVIGIVYAICSAGAILILDRAPHGHEAIKAMLVGSVLFVTWPVVLKTAAIYIAVGILHFVLRKKFMLISTDLPRARAEGLWIRWWDFLFYITFGFVVTSSVQIAGVLLVFTYLVVPAVCAMLFLDSILPRLILGWALGFAGSILGLYASAQWDLPTGASVVVTFGMILIISSLLNMIINNPRRQTGSR